MTTVRYGESRLEGASTPHPAACDGVSDPEGEEAPAHPIFLREWLSLCLVALFSACIFLYAHFPAFSNPYVINDDVRQQIYWMQKWRDPGLYPNDWLSDYARHYVPWGVQGVYRAVSPLVDPLYFSKVLPGFLFVFLAFLLYLTGKVIGGQRLGWVAVTVFWLMPFFLDNLAGGLSRSFAAPLLALFIYSWLIEKPSLIGATILLQALFIPYILILACTALSLAYVGGVIRRGSPPPFPKKPTHFVVMALSGILVFLWHWSLNEAGYGPVVSYAEMLGRPEFTEAGRYAILPVPSLFWELFGDPLEFLAFLNDGKIFAGIVTCVLLAGTTLYGARHVKWRSLTKRMQPFLYVGLASLVLYILARILLLRLFIPARYLTYSINLFYCLTLAVCIHGVLQKKALSTRAFFFILVLVSLLAGTRLREVQIYDYSADHALYTALENTPKDTLVAGYPDLMDNVLTFARRPVLTSFELAHPWCNGLWARLQPRLQDFFAAYYTDDPRVVIEFARKYDIDFMVVDTRHYEQDFLNGHPFFAPFGDMIRKAAKGKERFALLGKDTFSATTVNDHQCLLDLRPFRQTNSKANF